jgi:hypothetical protein
MPFGMIYERPRDPSLKLDAHRDYLHSAPLGCKVRFRNDPSEAKAMRSSRAFCEWARLISKHEIRRPFGAARLINGSATPLEESQRQPVKVNIEVQGRSRCVVFGGSSGCGGTGAFHKRRHEYAAPMGACTDIRSAGYKHGASNGAWNPARYCEWCAGSLPR